MASGDDELTPSRPVTAQEMLDSPAYQEHARKRRELVRLARPLIWEQLKSIPFYQALEHDEQFWKSYVGSAVVAARTLVNRSLGRPDDYEADEYA